MAFITENEQERFMELIKQATRVLDVAGADQFSRYINELVAIGKFLEEVTRGEFAKKRTERDNKPENSVDSVLDELLKGRSNKIQNMYAFRAFAEAWEDRSFVKKPNNRALPDHRSPEQKKDRKTLVLKAGMNASVRRRINLALTAMTKVIITEHDPDYFPEYDPMKAAQINKAASDAIATYKTPRQKVLAKIGEGLTGLVAFAFGFTNGAGVFTVLSISTLALSMPVILIAAVSIVVASTLVNWMIFKNPVYNFLNDIIGKDSYFEGLISYVNDAGEKTTLKGGRIAALFASLLLAASVGLAAGAMTFTSILGLGVLESVAALGLSAIFPPLAFILAPVAVICITALMFKSFVSMLKESNIKSTVLALFASVEDVFDSENVHHKGKTPARLRTEKTITYIVVGVLAVIGVLSLVMASLASTGALGTFLTTHILGAGENAVAIATAVSYTVGMGLAFVGQIPFVVEAMAKMVANIATVFRNNPLISWAPKQQVNHVSEDMSILEKERGRFDRILDGFGSFGSFLLKATNAVGNGMLIIPSLAKLLEGLVSIPLATLFARISGGGAGLNSLSAGISSSAPPTKDDKKRELASNARMLQLLGSPAQRENYQKTGSPIYVVQKTSKKNDSKIENPLGAISMSVIKRGRGMFDALKAAAKPVKPPKPGRAPNVENDIGAGNGDVMQTPQAKMGMVNS